MPPSPLRLQGLLGEASRVKSVEIALDNWAGPVRLVLTGDEHLGNAATDESLIEETTRRLEGEDVYWIDLGDAIDAINMRDPRFDPRSLPDWIGMADLIDLPAAQVARYRHWFGGLGGNCLARLYGNHEFELQRRYERDIYAELNRAIELPPERALGYSGFVRIRFRNRGGSKNRILDTWTQTIYIHHGCAGGKLMGAKAISLERLPSSWDADIYAVGHSHTRLAFGKPRIGMASKKVATESHRQIFVNVGSYMTGLNGYAERKGYPPQEPGPVELWFYPSERKVKIIQ